MDNKAIVEMVSNENAQVANMVVACNQLETVSLTQLFDTVFDTRPVVVEGLLHAGVYILAGAPKIGKSFFAELVSYYVSTGKTLWQYDTTPGYVLYMALEDDYQRIQKRYYRMFGAEGAEKLHFTTQAKTINTGLIDQLIRFVAEHPGTKLIVIDTLQMIRDVANEKYSYSQDYEVMRQLKQFADSHGICVLLVHHTRKQMSDDKFEMISGTTGLLGAVDGAMIMTKDKRTANTALIAVSGRDLPDQQLVLKRNPERLTWELDHAEVELWQQPTDPVLEQIDQWLTADWTGTATDLCNLAGVQMQPNMLSRHLNVNKRRLQSEYNIDYQATRAHAGRSVTLRRITPASDGTG